MTREYSPGDVAMVTISGEEMLAVRGRGIFANNWYTAGPFLGSRTVASASMVSHARPLVVIDPEDRAQVERLIRAQIDSRAGCSDALVVADTQVDGMQAALHSLIVPPRPPEPTGLGAVARSGDTGALVRVTPSTAPGLWVNSRLPDEVLPWDGISLPLTVLSEGVTP